MNYYGPREITREGKPTGLYRYTGMNDGRIWATGYCAQDCPGHPTKAEACEHQKQYDLDHRLRLDDTLGADVAHRCQVCQEWTQGAASVDGWQHYILCDKHRTREEVAKLYSVGTSISSY